MTVPETDELPARGLAWLYVIGGALGLAASIALILERLASLRDADYIPTCSLNPVIACGSVMDSAQASAFGFPNPLLGIASFAVVVTVGVALLAGFRPPRWFWLGMQAGATFGVLFVHWLIFASLYDIRALCPYCMVVWAVTIPIFLYTTQWVVLGRLAKLHWAYLAGWYALIAALVLHAFWDYWTSLW